MVVPSSVLDNWASELDKFCPALYFVKYHGSQKDRLALRHSLNRVSSGHAKEDMPVSERADKNPAHALNNTPLPKQTNTQQEEIKSRHGLRRCTNCTYGFWYPSLDVAGRGAREGYYAFKNSQPPWKYFFRK